MRNKVALVWLPPVGVFDLFCFVWFGFLFVGWFVCLFCFVSRTIFMVSCSTLSSFIKVDGHIVSYPDYSQ